MQIISKENILKNLLKQASKLSLRSEEDLHKLKKAFSREFKTDLPTNFSLQVAYEELIKRRMGR